MYFAAKCYKMLQTHFTSILTIDELHELKRREALMEADAKAIRHHWESFADRLESIRKDGLYKAFGTFEEYCQIRWSLTSRRVNQLRDGVEVIRNLKIGTIVPILPATESQARPLAKLEPELQREVWAEVVHDNGPEITAAKVEEVVERWIPANDKLRELKEENKPSIFNPAPRPVEQLIDEVKQEVKPRLNVHFTSDTDEWYTPSEIVKGVFELWGSISLDPCSNSKEKPNIPAGTHYTKADDGLSQEWFGRVYVNPPYGRVIQEWTDKAADEYEAGNLEAAILLVPARTDTAWMARLRAYPRCFVRGRLKFSNSPDAAPFPSCVVYLGPDESRFARVFSQFGDVYKLIEV